MRQDRGSDTLVVHEVNKPLPRYLTCPPPSHTAGERMTRATLSLDSVLAYLPYAVSTIALCSLAESVYATSRHLRSIATSLSIVASHTCEFADEIQYRRRVRESVEQKRKEDLSCRSWRSACTQSCPPSFGCQYTSLA